MRISDWSSDVCSSDLTDDIARDRLVLGDERLGVAAQVDVDVAALDALDDAGHQLTDAILPLVHDLRPLGLEHALHDHLLGGLGGDAAEIAVVDLLVDEDTDLGPFALVDRVRAEA